MDHADPQVAVIGAGISGLTAGKMLKDYGVPLHDASRRPTGSAATGRSATPTDTAAPTARCTSTPPSIGCRSRTSRCPSDYPVVPAPHRDQGLPRRLRRRVRAAASQHRVRATASCTPSRARTAAGRITDQAGADAATSTCWWSPTATTGIRGLPDFPGDVHRRVDPLASLHRSVDAARPDRQADPRRRASATAPPTSPSSCRRRRCSNTVTLSTRSSAWIVPEVHRGPARRQVLRAPRRTSRCPGSARRSSGRAVHAGSDPTLYGLPHAESQVLRGASRPSRSSCRCGSAPATWCPSPTSTRLDGDTVHFEDGTSDDFDVIVYATGYNITFPFFDPEFISAPGQPDPALQADVQARHRRPGLHRLRPVGADAVPVRRVPGAAAGGLRRRPVRAAVGRRDGAGDRRRSAAVRRATASTGPRHTQQVDYFVYEHDLRKRELPAGMKRARRTAAGGSMTPDEVSFRQRRMSPAAPGISPSDRRREPGPSS